MKIFGRFPSLCVVALVPFLVQGQMSYHKTMNVGGGSVLASNGSVYITGIGTVVREDLNGQTIWQKSYAPGGQFGGGLIKQNAQGDLVVLAIDMDGFRIMWVDTVGTFLQGFQYSVPGSNFFPEAMEVDDDGNVYVIERWSCRVVKVTPSGAVAWTRHFFRSGTGYDESPGAIKARPDGDLHISAGSGIPGIPGTNHQMVLHRMDTSGVLVSTMAWAHTGPLGEPWFPHQSKVLLRPDGKLLHFARLDSLGYPRGLFCMLTEGSGAVIWRTHISSMYHMADWQLLPDMSALLFGTFGDLDLKLARLSAAGWTIFHKTILSPEYVLTPGSMMLLPDGGALVNGGGHLIRMDDGFQGPCIDIPATNANASFWPEPVSAAAYVDSTFTVTVDPFVAVDSTYSDYAYFCGSVGVEEVGINDVLTISPNPADDHILVQRGSESPVDLVLRDATGRALRVFAESQPSFQMDVSDLPEGTYFMEIAQRTGRAVEKLIVIH